MSTSTEPVPKLTSHTASIPLGKQAQIFYRTAGAPCPYLPNRIERHILADLTGSNAEAIHNFLTTAGFRRSHHLIYRPSCLDCSACIPVRIITAKFTPSRTQRRTFLRNSHLQANLIAAVATQEQFDLFKQYQKMRHDDGEMARMSFEDFRLMIEGSPVHTRIAEFRDSNGLLKAVCLLDILKDGFSAVYSFFDPETPLQSLGTYVILWAIREAQAHQFSYIYLGYWVSGSPKMSYKIRFQPLEQFSQGHWKPFSNGSVA